MGKMKIVTVAIILTAVFICGNPERVLVHKARAGETAVLPCLTEDEAHRFQYWLLNDNQVLGPWNNDNHGKVKYEIWTGRLMIKGVSEKESGLYKCFSKHIRGTELVSGAIELMVIKDWGESNATDIMVNTYRAVIGVLVLLMITMIGLFAFFIKRRKRFGFQDSKEDSPDDILSAAENKGVYRTTSMSLSKPSTSKSKSDPRSYDNAIVETDITTSFSLPN